MEDAATGPSLLLLLPLPSADGSGGGTNNIKKIGGLGGVAGKALGVAAPLQMRGVELERVDGRRCSGAPSP